LIAEMRTAQVAYVALGQGQDFWMGRVTTMLPGLQQHMSDFKSKLTATAAQTASSRRRSPSTIFKNSTAAPRTS
jgi:hypothetical protein